MATTTAELNDLIEVLHDGSNFYLEAATAVADSDCKLLFQRMADGKRAIAADLATHVAARGEEASIVATTVAGALRENYAKLRAALSDDKDGRYIAELEDTEDRILHRFEAATFDSDNPDLVAIAGKHLTEVRAAHDQMRVLKKDRGY